MKKHHNNLPFAPLLVCLALFWAALAAATAQPTDDNGLLYFPPKLKVEASTDQSWWMRIFYTRGREYDDYEGSDPAMQEDPPSPPMENRLVFTRTFSTNTLTPLPIVFFDLGSYVIPERYQQFSGSNLADEYTDSAQIDLKEDGGVDADIIKYYEILNIIGYRLSNAPEVSISLEGGYSIEPGESPELASERAQVVKEYLTNIWHIAPERIALIPPRLACDSAANLLQREEARRVTIYSDSFSLFRPVNYPTSHIFTPLMAFSITLDPQMLPQDIASIDLIMASGDDIFGQTSIPVSPDSSIYHLLGLGGIPRKLEDVEEGIIVQAFVHTIDGKIRGSNQIHLAVIIQDEERNDDLYDTTVAYVETTAEETEWEEDGVTGSEEEYGRSDVDSTTMPDYPDIVAYPQGNMCSYAIPFYESQDTTLSGMQKMWFRDAVDSLTRNINAAPGVKWEVRLFAQGERGEIPDMADELIAGQMGSFRRIRSYYSSMMEDRSFRMALYIVPPTLPQLTGAEESMDIVNTLMKAWYGDRAEEATSIQKDYATLYNNSNFTDAQLDRIDTFLVHRSDGVASYFRTLDTAVVDTIVIFGVGRGASSLQFADSPEKRFYSRQVYVTVSPSYRSYYSNEYGDDYYGRDEYYEEDSSGQESEEYEEGEDYQEEHEEGYSEEGIKEESKEESIEGEGSDPDPQVPEEKHNHESSP